VWATAGGFSGDDRFDITVGYGRVTFPYIFFMSLAALFSGILNATGRFAVAAAAPVLLNVMVIAAMLAARADQGPSLVIAPASVTRNWLSETERFAPSLVPVLIASGADTPLLSQLGTGDLALVSYGLLPFIGEELTEIDWANIILDEAQAIKNAATKRAKTVQQLRGDFKLATTGTPIENHLGELWSLFRFLNPGLLGGKTAFNEKYNRPIARDGDEDRRNALKNLVKPFILRRRKDEVLTELPPKTEIVLNVNLSEEEKALYEAMRRNAVREIAAADEQQKRFTVLAQLTKLRQAACHPRLVRPHSKLGSAKLELVGETLLEILESGHKALIFSQFVKHLKIVENWVKGQGIAYQYLDGSTPGKKRAESVEAFQAGEGQVFLISLKAGGTGLNLTAADYVLHLDPWWNPAAEDQASDRAHRIGQQRPVTVYRFVSAGTIEEQIIALHAEKRDLADQILAGTGQAGALSVEDIMGMLR
ncbi:MAG: SNF2-related protein, partial [Bacteroidota bacterium]